MRHGSSFTSAFFLLTSFFTCVSCSSGGGGDQTSPGVNITPVDGSIDVAPDATITATFSEDILAITVDSSSFLLNCDGAPSVESPQLGSLSASQYTLTPSAPLGLLQSCSVNLTSKITDLSGNPLGNTESIFTTRDGSWKPAQLIEYETSYNTSAPNIASADDNFAIAVWTQRDGTRGNIWAREYDPVNGWSTAELIETSDANASEPVIAMDNAGNAIAVWLQGELPASSLWANHYTRSDGWGTARLIGIDDSGVASFQQIGMSNNGHALVTWLKSSGGPPDILANHYAPGDGWGSPAPIENYAGSVARPTVAIGENGNGIAVWTQYTDYKDNVWANHFTVDSGWGVAESIESVDSEYTSYPVLDMDPKGNALVIWVQSNGNLYDPAATLWSTRYVSGSGWQPAIKLPSVHDATDFPAVSVSDDGEAIAVWSDYDGTRFNLWSSRYKPTKGWDTATLIETDDAGPAIQARVATDSRGNALVIWPHYDGSRNNIWSNRYRISGGWEQARLLETDDLGGTDTARISVNGNGRAFAIWRQHDGSVNNIWSSLFY